MAAQMTHTLVSPQAQVSSWNLALASAPECFRHLQLGPGEPLWREGDVANSVAMVLSGKISLKKALPDSTSQLVLGVCGAEAILGESGLLEGQIRDESAVALEKSLVTMISRDDFRRLAGFHAAIAQSFMQEVLGSLQGRLVGTVFRLTTMM